GQHRAGRTHPAPHGTHPGGHRIRSAPHHRMKRSVRSIPLIGALLLLGTALHAQVTRVHGTVTDAATGEPVPFANVAFIDARIGTTTDMDGRYTLETYYATDSLRFSSVGYRMAVRAVRRDRDQVINVALEPSAVELAEAIIKPQEENPAFEILRRVVRNKPVNNREKLAAYEYQAYNKVEFDLNNITEEFTQKKLFQPFAFIFDNID